MVVPHRHVATVALLTVEELHELAGVEEDVGAVERQDPRLDRGVVDEHQQDDEGRQQQEPRQHPAGDPVGDASGEQEQRNRF